MPSNSFIRQAAKGRDGNPMSRDPSDLVDTVPMADAAETCETCCRRRDLMKYRPFLLKHMDVGILLLQILVQGGMLLPQQAYIISEVVNREERVKRFLEVIELGLDISSFRVFTDALKSSGQNHVVQTLEEEICADLPIDINHTWSCANGRQKRHRHKSDTSAVYPTLALRHEDDETRHGEWQTASRSRQRHKSGPPSAHHDTAAEDDKSFRIPNHIPTETTRSIKERHDPSTSRPTYFLPELPTNVIHDMVLTTCRQPDFSQVDPKTSKKIHRYKRFGKVIGKHAVSKEGCCWLEVIAKRNSWITAAYPVNDPNVKLE